MRQHVASLYFVHPYILPFFLPNSAQLPLYPCVALGWGASLPPSSQVKERMWANASAPPGEQRQYSARDGLGFCLHEGQHAQQSALTIAFSDPCVLLRCLLLCSLFFVPLCWIEKGTLWPPGNLRVRVGAVSVQNGYSFPWCLLACPCGVAVSLPVPLFLPALRGCYASAL